MVMIKYSEEKDKGNVLSLIPVHINKMKCDNYFWNWNSNQKDWVRGEKLTEHYKKLSKSPLVKSNYK